MSSPPPASPTPVPVRLAAYAAMLLAPLACVVLVAEGVYLAQHKQLFARREAADTASFFRAPILRETKSARRLLTIGGSTTYGMNVPQDATWPAVLERHLNEDAPGWEVVNLGMLG